LERNPDEAEARVRTRTIAWRQNAASLNSELGRSELCDALSRMAAEEKLRGAPVQVALSRDFCVTRVVAGAAGNVRQELRKLEQRAALYLGLGSGRKATSTTISALDARHEHGLLAVANQKVLDGLFATLVQAGLRPARIEPSLLAICRVLGHTGADAEAPQLIINLAEGGLDLGISYRGQLLLDYRPVAKDNNQDVAAIVTQHWSRLERYCARYWAQTNHQKKGARLLRLHLFGPDDAVRAAKQSFPPEGEIKVEAFDPATLESSWRYTGEGPRPQQTAALGACLAASESSRSSLGPNLLERILAEQHENLLPVVARIGWPIAAVVLLGLILGGLNIQQQRSCAELARQIEALEPARSKAWQLEVTCVQAQEQIDHLQRIRQGIANRPWDAILLNVAQCLPEGVWLNRLNVKATENLGIAGMCYDDERAFEVVRWLEKTPQLQDVQIEGMQPQRLPSGPATSFTIHADFAQAAPPTDSAPAM
jgi:Tfp pilus assembly protein PilN